MKKACYYFTNWGIYARGYPPKQIPLDFVSEITYAFLELKQNPAGHYVIALTDVWADVDKRFIDLKEGVPPLDSWNDPPGAYYGCFGQFKKIKALRPDFIIGISIGGWTKSKYFSKAVESPAARQAFCDSIIEFVTKYTWVDIVDFDWEHISPIGQNFGDGGNIVQENDGPNFVEFLKLLRVALDKTGRRIEITMATTGNPSQMVALPVEQLTPLLKEFRVMTYDFASSAWGPQPASHQSNLFKTPTTPLSIDGAVQAYMKRGVPAEKILIGVPFYSRGFANTNGLGQPSNGLVKNKSWEDGISDYKDLPIAGSTELWDDAAKAAYCYDPKTRDLNSYDTPRTIAEKSKYVWEKGLGGFIIWEISGDVRDVQSPRSLIRAIYENLLAKDAGLAQVTKTLALSNGMTYAPPPVEAAPATVQQPIRQTPIQPVQQAVPPKQATVWTGDGKAYTKGDVVTLTGLTFVCLQPHYSQPDWQPSFTPSLWQKQ